MHGKRIHVLIILFSSCFHTLLLFAHSFNTSVIKSSSNKSSHCSPERLCLPQQHETLFASCFECFENALQSTFPAPKCLTLMLSSPLIFNYLSVCPQIQSCHFLHSFPAESRSSRSSSGSAFKIFTFYFPADCAAAEFGSAAY